MQFGSVLWNNQGRDGRVCGVRRYITNNDDTNNVYAKVRRFLDPLGRVRSKSPDPGFLESFPGTTDRATGLSSKVKRSYSDAI